MTKRTQRVFVLLNCCGGYSTAPPAAWNQYTYLLAHTNRYLQNVVLCTITCWIVLGFNLCRMLSARGKLNDACRPGPRGGAGVHGSRKKRTKHDGLRIYPIHTNDCTTPAYSAATQQAPCQMLGSARASSALISLFLSSMRAIKRAASSSTCRVQWRKLDGCRQVGALHRRDKICLLWRFRLFTKQRAQNRAPCTMTSFFIVFGQPAAFHT